MRKVIAALLVAVLPMACGYAQEKKDDAKKDEEKVEPVAIDVASYRVSPDGKTIAIFAADPETPGEKKAKDAKADLLVVGSHSHQLLDRLLGTTAAKIIDHSPCSTLVVR